YITIITVLHIVIDVLKSLFENKNKVSDFIVFIVDQVVHLLIIFITWQFFDLNINQTVSSFYKLILTHKPVLAEILTVANGIKILLAVIVYIYSCWGGAIFIKKLLYLLGKGEAKAGKKIVEEIYNIGYLIGILERLIIITLVINQALSTVGFIFAAKSIARYKDLENKEFAEYYLVGTLASTALAIFGGLLLNFFYQSLV
ncbi:MAG TPA: DUF3307 domain-containing protein, partial [Bacillota bacterium]|nr:DUF3307 domain-containing protein [Bacillota bacterium]HOL10428.1 DUF3307 domain-containing protein [Bacillota bacterium]HPO98366.1 DUF3307 domain-containing protein [Bacillota bacterium]